MTKKAYIGIVAVLAGSMLAAGFEPAKAGRRKKVVLIYCDVTSSLSPGDVKTVAGIAAAAIRNLKPPAVYEVIPISINTERNNSIIRQDVPSLVKPSDKKSYQSVLRRLEIFINKTLSNLYADVNGAGKDPDRSCIIESLERASSFFDQYRRNPEYDLHLIVISDMIEECRRSPWNTPIRLNHEDLSKEIKMARNPAAMPNLSGVNIAFVVPPSSSPVSQDKRPSLRALREFWGAVVARSGVTPVNLSNPNVFYFGVGLPRRLSMAW